MRLNDDQLAARLKKVQSPARYRHSLAVADLAELLAARHGWNPAAARRAGLLHDWAKEWPPDDLKIYAKNNRLRVPAFDFICRVAPNLLHAYVGAHFVYHQRWVDRRSMKAISAHTLGALNMGAEDKILYIADLASPDRVFKEAAVVRTLAAKSLDAGFREAVAVKVLYQVRKGKPLHPMTVSVWNKIHHA